MEKPSITAFFAYPDPVIWIKFGIKKVGDVSNGMLLQVDTLKTKYKFAKFSFISVLAT